MMPPPANWRPLTPKQIRRRGWILIALGLSLTLFMGWIAVVVIGIMLHSNDPDARTRFTGGQGMKVFTLGVFGVVIGFGLLSMLTGAWQVRYGKQNPHFVRWMLWMACALGAFSVLAGVMDTLD